MPKFPGQGLIRLDFRRSLVSGLSSIGLNESRRDHVPEKTFLIIIIMRENISAFVFYFQFVGIVFSCYLGIGAGLGSMIGGFLIDIIGGSWTFLLSGGVTAIVLVLCVLSLVITRLLYRMKNSEMERKTEDYDSS